MPLVRGQLFACFVAGLLVPLSGSTKAIGAAIFCDAGPQGAASTNARSLETMAWSPLGRREMGWDIYVPRIAQEIGTGCSPASPGFAEALANWQANHATAATGVLNPATFAMMKQLWQARRPFVALSHVSCPAPPDERDLAVARPEESYDGKRIELLPAALAAYRNMVAAARAELLFAKSDRQLLAIFSGYRSPEYDAARCVRDKNCQGLVRAACSAHRTGYAMDLYLGSAPGYAPDSSADENRLYLSRSPVYRWLVYNAWRFGFANYLFEPWHWEWTGR